MSDFSVYFRVGFRGPSGQGRGPDIDAVARCDSKAGQESRVAAETLVKDNLVVLAGEITTGARVNYDAIARATIKRIGYNDPAIGFDTHTCTVIVAYGEQVAGHRAGRGRRKGPRPRPGRGRPGPHVRYACDETPGLMPLPIYLSHRLVERQSEVRRDGRMPWLRPDAKSQVTVKYVNGKPDSIETIVLSTQHAPDMTHKQIEEAVIEQVIKPVLAEEPHQGQGEVPRQPDRRVRDRRPEGRLRPHRPQDHRRHLRRLRAARRPARSPARIRRKWIVSCLRRTLCREEHRRRPASPRSAWCRCPTPSAWRNRPASW